MHLQIAFAGALIVCAFGAGAQPRRVDAIEISRTATVKVASQSGASVGTGFFVADRYVLTCFHVVADVAVEGPNATYRIFDDLAVILPSGEAIPVTVVTIPTASAPEPLTQDFAVVKLRKAPPTTPNIIHLAAENEWPKVGDDVVFSGFPLATPGMVTHRGMVSGYDDSRTLIFVEASINKGNSGGALLNGQGHAIGIVSMREGGISQGLADLKTYIGHTSEYGSVQVMGVDPLQSTRAIIETLDRYISTGIGYARSITFAREFVEKHRVLHE